MKKKKFLKKFIGLKNQNWKFVIQNRFTKKDILMKKMVYLSNKVILLLKINKLLILHQQKSFYIHKYTYSKAFSIHQKTIKTKNNF